MVPDIFSFPESLYASTSNDTNENHYDRDDQEGMNESAHGVRGYDTQKSEDNHDDRNGLEHVASPFAITWPIVSLAAYCRRETKEAQGPSRLPGGAMANFTFGPNQE
jgi:hypothetical protein